MFQEVRLGKLIIVPLILLCSFCSLVVGRAETSRVKRVAILPLRDLSAGSADELKIRALLLDVLKSKGYLQIVDMSVSDKALRESGFFNRGKIEIDKLQQMGDILGVDLLLFGSITTYHIPDRAEKGAGSVIPLLSTIAKAEVIVKLYDTKLRKVVWTKLVTGYSKPFLLKMESFMVNIEAALNSFKKEFNYCWSGEVEKIYRN